MYLRTPERAGCECLDLATPSALSNSPPQSEGRAKENPSSAALGYSEALPQAPPLPAWSGHVAPAAMDRAVCG